MKQGRLHFWKTEPGWIVQLVDGVQKISEMSSSHTQDLVVTVIRKEFHKTFAEVLHVQIRSTFVQNFRQTCRREETFRLQTRSSTYIRRSFRSTIHRNDRVSWMIRARNSTLERYASKPSLRTFRKFHLGNSQEEFRRASLCFCVAFDLLRSFSWWMRWKFALRYLYKGESGKEKNRRKRKRASVQFDAEIADVCLMHLNSRPMHRHSSINDDSFCESPPSLIDPEKSGWAPVAYLQQCRSSNDRRTNRRGSNSTTNDQCILPLAATRFYRVAWR